MRVTKRYFSPRCFQKFSKPHVGNFLHFLQLKYDFVCFRVLPPPPTCGFGLGFQPTVLSELAAWLVVCPPSQWEALFCIFSLYMRVTKRYFSPRCFQKFSKPHVGNFLHFLQLKYDFVCYRVLPPPPTWDSNLRCCLSWRAAPKNIYHFSGTRLQFQPAVLFVGLEKSASWCVWGGSTLYWSETISEIILD